MFVDVARIELQAGNGGNGAISFHREKYVAAGGPDGGDGGKGGSIIFKANSNLSTLADFRYKRKYKAQNGENGKASKQTGKSAENLIIEVPVGTIVRDANTKRIIADISDDEPRVIAEGGKGGLGNRHFANSTRQIPRFAKPGVSGEYLEVELELKLLADVGLVGFPNVGKSTLISVVSKARPNIANYHFTTIIPNLGVVKVGDVSFVMADIPGLIEGAGEGAGLGHQFLRHVERCRLLIHIVDIAGSEGRNPIEDFEQINKELRVFNAELAERPMIVVGNKADLASDEQIKEFKEYIENKGYKFFPIMAPISYGTKELMNETVKMLAELPPIVRYKEEPKPETEVLDSQDRSVKIEKHGETYVITGEWLIQLMNSVNFDDFESLHYFERVLIKTGVMGKLRKAGVKEGDTVSMYDMEFEFFD